MSGVPCLKPLAEGEKRGERAVPADCEEAETERNAVTKESHWPQSGAAETKHVFLFETRVQSTNKVLKGFVVTIRAHSQGQRSAGEEVDEVPGTLLLRKRREELRPTQNGEILLQEVKLG